MMDHIRQFDWCSSSAHTPYFVEESALDNCNTEKIIMNRFIDPLLSSDDDELVPNNINWDDVFKAKINTRAPKLFIPGMRPIPPYPKVSALSEIQHYRALRVLCAMYPTVLEEAPFHRPALTDSKTFEMIKEIYDKEKKEYIQWAKSMWFSDHCVRALRPKPTIETIYDAEFKVRARRLNGFPKQFDMAAQMPLECSKDYQYEATLNQTLVEVNIYELPEVHIPHPLSKISSIIRPCSVPEPCCKHPYQFILPNENSVSILPITEIHRSLAQFAAEHGVRLVASENALRCLVEFNRHWTVPVSVCTAFNQEGEQCSVVVLDSEVCAAREPAPVRTRRAYRHLLEHALLPSSEVEAALERQKKKRDKQPRKKRRASSVRAEPELSSDDELGLCIMEDNLGNHTNGNPDTADQLPEVTIAQPSQGSNEADSSTYKIKSFSNDVSMEDLNDVIGVYNCTCSDTRFEMPPLRSFRKWAFTNKSTKQSIDVIVHCAHKVRLEGMELLLEPVPEYQLELGASEQSADRIRSLALSLMLRKNAAVLKARVDGCNGDIVTLDQFPSVQWKLEHAAHWRQALDVLHTTLGYLQGLRPGEYVLQHETSHGANVMLHVAPSGAGGARCLWGEGVGGGAHDEAAATRHAPTITDALLPYHKHRKILPCAFSPFASHVVKELKLPPTKLKQPPQAIRWPKRRKRNRTKQSE